jgi:hypothetical protein
MATVTKQIVPNINQAGLEINTEKLRRVDAVVGHEEAQFLPEPATDVEKSAAAVGL